MTRPRPTEPGDSEPPISAELPVSAELPDRAEAAVSADLPDSAELPVRAELPDRAEAAVDTGSGAGAPLDESWPDEGCAPDRRSTDPDAESAPAETPDSANDADPDAVPDAGPGPDAEPIPDPDTAPDPAAAPDPADDADTAGDRGVGARPLGARDTEAVTRRVTVAVRFASRPAVPATRLPAPPPVDPASTRADRPPARPETGSAAGTTLFITALGTLRRSAGVETSGSGCARRIARARRSAVAGPGELSPEPGTATPTGCRAETGDDKTGDTDTDDADTDTGDDDTGDTDTGDDDTGDDCDDKATPPGEPGCAATAAGRRSPGTCPAPVVARATDRRSVAAIPAPLCWETAPALAARAGVGLPLPEEFPDGGAEPGDLDTAASGGATLGARNLRCSCELVIGPAAATSSIRRTGIAVDTSPPAMVPGERGWSSVGTCLAARARPRAGNAAAAEAPDGPDGPDAADEPDGADPTERSDSAAEPRPGVHQRGGRTSAGPIGRGATLADAASARRTATGRAVLAANRAADSATSPRLAARARPTGRPGRRSRWAAARPSLVRSTAGEPSPPCSVLIGSSTGSRDGRLRAVPARLRCWTN